MKVCFVTENSVNGVWQESLPNVSCQDLVVFGFNGLGLVSYKKELSGETEYFQDVAKLSKQLDSVVISGCDTDTYGVFRHSAVVAEKGKILGVTDMTHSVDESEFVAGGSYRVYHTSIGKIGVLVGEDLFFPESSAILSLCDADFIVCIFKKQENAIPQVVLRALAYCNGVPMALCAEGYAVVANPRGEVSLAGSSSTLKINVKNQRDYHDVGLRKRGLYRDVGSYC